MISIVIPTYEMHGRGVEFLAELINSIDEQSYTEHEVIISDDSEDDSIQVFCAGRNGNVKYYKNPGAKGAVSNLNNAILHAKGSIIKPMFQDDQFLDKGCLKEVAKMKGQWGVMVSGHLNGDGGVPRGDHVPYQTDDIFELARGCNTFGSPSAVAWKRTDITFDENLKWLFDCDFYAQMMLKYGAPEFIPSKVLIREWDGMATRTVADGGVRIAELGYIESKYSNLRL